jgi:hypothetical protein
LVNAGDRLPVDKTVEKWRFSEVDASSVFNNFGGFFNTPKNLMLPVCC